MASRRRSNRIQLQEVLEESRKDTAAEPPAVSAGDPAAASGHDAERDEPEGKKMSRKAESSLESRSSDKGSDRGRPRLRKVSRGRNNYKGKVGDSSPDDASEQSDGSDDSKLRDFGDEKPTDVQSKRTGEKRGEKKAGKRKRLTLHDLDDQGDDESDGDDSATLDRALDKNLNQTSVTSKPSSSLAIPKKRALESTTLSTSSLLANLKPAPPPVDPQQQPPSKRPPTSNKAKTISTSFDRPTKTTTPSHSPARGNSPKRDQQAIIIEAFSSSAVPSGPTTMAPLRGGPSKSQTHRSKGLTFPQQRVMNDLEQVCDVIGQDLRFSLPPSTSIDLSGSFLNDRDKDDFFDLNDAGEIVLQPRVPIFPEEFPPGVTQHSLAWWGILDPDLGDGKYKPEPAASDGQSTAPPPHGRNGAVDPIPPPPPVPVPYYALPAQTGPRSGGGYRGGGGGRAGGAPPPAYWRGGTSGAAAPPSNRAPRRLSPPREFERR